jgi:D-erythrulose 1-phosphate 3-epimerase
MGEVRWTLGVNDCFAVKRWPRPADWAPVVRDLGVTLVQHSLDLDDPGAPDEAVADAAAAVRDHAAACGLTVHSTFTGLAAYSSNLLLHPDAAARDRAEAWFARAIAFTAAAGGVATGGHVGAYSVPDARDPGRRTALAADLRARLGRLAGKAREAGLAYLVVENLAAAREPATTADIRSLLDEGDATRVPVRLCLDVGHMCVPGTSGDERDPYTWARALGGVAPVVQLQQSDAAGDHHWPFTTEANAAGRIVADPLLDALEASGAAEIALVLEVIPPFEQDDGAVLADMRASVAYWRGALARRGVAV